MVPCETVYATLTGESSRPPARTAQGYDALAWVRVAPYRDRMGPVHKLLSELDALRPLAPALLSLWAAAPKAIKLAQKAAEDTRAGEQLGQLTDEAIQHAAAATAILWENDELLRSAGAQLRRAISGASDDPRMRAALGKLKDAAMRSWDSQVERLVEGAMADERNDLADTFRVVEAVLDGLLHRILTAPDHKKNNK
jgi:hypothetical protein